MKRTKLKLTKTDKVKNGVNFFGKGDNGGKYRIFVGNKILRDLLSAKVPRKWGDMRVQRL